MKRLFLLILVATFCLLTGCKKQCEQPYKSKEIPKLKQNDYNSCEAVCKNYTYLICGSEASYPYWSHKGDTIMVYGYIFDGWGGNRSHFPLSNSTISHDILLYINAYDSPVQLPEEFDMSKKCYIKGRLDFHPLNTNGGPYLMTPVIHDIQELFFEEN